MTLLDDYQGLYKLRGVQIVAVMLGNVPGQLLKRTGVDSLLIQVRSCRTTTLLVLTLFSHCRHAWGLYATRSLLICCGHQ